MSYITDYENNTIKNHEGIVGLFLILSERFNVLILGHINQGFH